MVTIKRYKDMFLFKDPIRNINYPIDKDAMIAFIQEEQEELIIADRTVEGYITLNLN